MKRNYEMPWEATLAYGPSGMFTARAFFSGSFEDACEAAKEWAATVREPVRFTVRSNLDGNPNARENRRRAYKWCDASWKLYWMWPTTHEEEL